MYTLFYTPGACSIAPHIALREAGLPLQLEKVDLRAKKIGDADYTAVNPKGYVPALRLPDGQLLTEAAVMLQYLADQMPDKQLAPPFGGMERYRFMELLNFLATELHKGMNPMYNPTANEEFKTSLKARLTLRWSALATMLGTRSFLAGERFTVADAYAFYVMRAWQYTVKEDFAKWPELADYYRRLAARPSVAAALEAEGLEA